VDKLEADNIARSRRMTVAEKLRGALVMMRDGIDLKRSSLRNAHSDESEDQIEDRLRRWLREDG
jgi:hypothetical protein